MKSPYKIAKELKVSPQAVYKRMTDEFNNKFNNHIQRTPQGKYLLDGVAEKALKGLFRLVVEPVEQPTIEPVKQPVKQRSDSHLLNQLNNENNFLRTRIEVLEEELKSAQTHNREQSDKLAELANQLAEITRNNQILLGAEQSRTNPVLLGEKRGDLQDPKETDGDNNAPRKRRFFDFFKSSKS